MRRLLRWAAQQTIKLVLDESFVDFADENDTLLHNAILEENPHLTVVKSISKSYGVPGLRLGILASGDRELIAALKREVAIWNINSFAEYYLQIAEKYKKDYTSALEDFRQDRAWLLAQLQRIPQLRVLPSQANYFMCEVKGGMTATELAQRLLTENDLLIKDLSGKVALGRQYVRLAVRGQDDNRRLVAALRTVFGLDA